MKLPLQKSVKQIKLPVKKSDCWFLLGVNMYRNALGALIKWKDKSGRKPLVIRGARQVGKTWLVREFARECGFELMELNFDLDDTDADCFQSKRPEQIVALLELKQGKKIIQGQTLLFLDEVQAAPQVLASLRYFYELMPALHVIAAGSLLEFILEDHTFSMPVGRIEYFHLGPMGFKEFLKATGKSSLAGYLETLRLEQEFPDVIHQELCSALRLFLAVGGMPGVVSAYNDRQSLLDADEVKQSILLTFRDDFSKYGSKVNHVRLGKVFQGLPLLAGQKLKYVHLDRTDKSENLKKALHLLALARIYYPVFHTAAAGVPLRAQLNEKFQKPLFLDVGLLMSACGMDYTDIQSADDVALVNSGPVCEQFIGQHLLYRNPAYYEPELFYWCRERRQSASEVDYIINVGPDVIPVEVKAGKTGRLKSLHVFLKEKQGDLGIRFNMDKPCYHPVPFALPNTRGQFYLLSLPLYMVEELLPIIRDL